MTPKQPIDFIKVESLRKHMLLTTSDLAGLLGVSRMTYYGWVRGQSLRQANDEKVRAMLRRLLTVMTEHHWPTPQVIAAAQAQRLELLKAVLEQIK
jgi:DNA-binding XRE family transcriptional regulator